MVGLLAHEADVLAQDLNGKTPADFAQKQGKSHTEELIHNQLRLYQQEEAVVQPGDKAVLRDMLTKDTRRYALLHVFAQACSKSRGHT